MADVPNQTSAVGTQVQGNILPAGAPGAQALEIEWVPSKLKMIQISSGELDAVLSSSASIHIGFLGISLGGLVSLGSTLATVPISNPSAYVRIPAHREHSFRFNVNTDSGHREHGFRPS